METTEEFIHIEKIGVNVEINMRGDIKILSSIVYTAMLFNVDLADAILNAAHYYNDKINENEADARLN